MIIVCELRDWLYVKGIMPQERWILLAFNFKGQCCLHVVTRKKKKSKVNSQTTTTHQQAVLKLLPHWHRHIGQTNPTAIIKYQPQNKKREIILVHDPKLPCNFTSMASLEIHICVKLSVPQPLCSINQHISREHRFTHRLSCSSI